MQRTSFSDYPDPTYTGSKEAYRSIVRRVSSALPLPLTNTPEEIARRNRGAIAEMASLCPTNPAEMSLAALYVVASADSIDCFRASNSVRMVTKDPLRSSSVGGSLARAALGAIRTLRVLQADRRKRQADQKGSDTDVQNSVQTFPDSGGKQRPIVSTLVRAILRRLRGRVWGVLHGYDCRNPPPSLGQQGEHQLDRA